MAAVTLDHFKRAAADIGRYGDNDTLPFDIDNRFVADRHDELANIAFSFFQRIDKKQENDVRAVLNALSVFSERLLAPAGPAGFRITTKIHPFWNIYFNGLGVAIAHAHEAQRSARAHSYRYVEDAEGLFDRASSWRAYLQATIDDQAFAKENAVVVKTDISSFYERLYHHRIENRIVDLFPKNRSMIAVQVDRFLNKFANGRSFGLPVGGQCARILAELMMTPIDQILTEAGIVWHRYVDDFTLITSDQAEAYGALSELSHALADYGLSLNRTKTLIMNAKHYKDFVHLQLGTSEDHAGKLRDIDLHFDPYSDTAEEDYEHLRDTVEQLQVQTLLDLELQKSQPDPFLVAQIGRTLELHPPETALQLCTTLLNPKNLNSFRGSWATIMRGIANVRGRGDNASVFDRLDRLLDDVPDHSRHLLLPEANCLHYLRTIRFKHTEVRAKYVNRIYGSSQSQTVRRACIDCWRIWKDRSRFIQVRNQWASLRAEEQRMFWLAASSFDDDGEAFHRQESKTLQHLWRLGSEHGSGPSFGIIYQDWTKRSDV